jgi:sporulation protein YlmC with PRC-barrel domain
MSTSIQFEIGTTVSCSDGDCGTLTRVVVDPVSRTLTHLVVEPESRRGLGRLVPIDLVEPATKEIHLRCTTAEFEAFESAEETKFLPGTGGDWGYGSGQVLAWPYYGLGMGVGGMGGMGMGLGMGNAPQPVTYDKVPAGEIAIHRGEQVHATDGDIGKVQGLVIDPQSHHVTHVLLQEGHLWGKKEVAIPIGSVTSVSDGIHLSLAKDEVQELPEIEVDPPAGDSPDS